MAPGGKGLLSSVSVLATSPRFEECAPLLDACSDELRISVHLNFVEGPCAANPEDLPLLVDEKGFFKLGYGGLLAASVGPRSAELERELRSRRRPRRPESSRASPERRGTCASTDTSTRS